MEKKDQPEWMTNGRSAGKQERVVQIMIVFDWLRLSCVPDFTFRRSQTGTGTLLCLNDVGTLLRRRQSIPRSD
jgi:hypothetical protein